jgi:hypothetical protein
MNQNLYDAPSVGKDTLTYCGKCKLDLAHVIVAMDGATPAKVQCKTCRSTHNYKRKVLASIRTPKTKTAKIPKPKTSADWERRLTERTTKVNLDYSPKEKYKMGDCLMHSKFGLGLVEEVKVNGKIIVLFREGEVTLVHGIS